MATDTRVADPVCGMDVDPATATHRHEHDGTTYFLCSAACREKFAVEPARWLAPAAADHESACRHGHGRPGPAAPARPPSAGPKHTHPMQPPPIPARPRP